MATHSSILACRTPWTEEPGGLQSTGSQRGQGPFLSMRSVPGPVPGARNSGMNEADAVSRVKTAKISSHWPLTGMQLHSSEVPPRKYTGGWLCKDAPDHSQVHIPTPCPSYVKRDEALALSPDPSGEPGVSGDFWGSQEGCQGPSRPSGRNRGLPLRRRRGCECSLQHYFNSQNLESAQMHG